MEIKFLNPATIFFFSVLMTFFNIKFFHNLIKAYIKSPDGPQKIHKGSISRLGGLSIFIILACISILWINKHDNLFLKYVIISLPVFVIGLFEDITQSISPKLRLYGSFLSGILFILIFDISLTNVDISFLNILLSYKSVSIIFTLLCITYIIQAFNIIDGLNGLSLSTAAIIFLSIINISSDVGDNEIFFFSINFLFILLGVLFFNFPYGKIFIGDSGAYIIGLYISITVIMLAEKNSEISPFLVVVILIYPAYEIMRSFLRRLILKRNIFKPDKRHLHSILYIYNSYKFSLMPLKANSLSSLQIIFIQFLNFIFISNYYKSENLIIVDIFTFIIIYEILYNFVSYKIKNHRIQPHK